MWWPGQVRRANRNVTIANPSKLHLRQQIMSLGKHISCCVAPHRSRMSVSFSSSPVTLSQMIYTI